MIDTPASRYTYKRMLNNEGKFYQKVRWIIRF